MLWSTMKRESSTVAMATVFFSGVVVVIIAQFIPYLFVTFAGQLYPYVSDSKNTLQTLNRNSGLSKFSSFSLLPSTEIVASADWSEHLVPNLPRDNSPVSSIVARRKELENTSIETEAIASLNAALEMRVMGKLEKASKLFEHALNLCPLHPDILNHYGEFVEHHNSNFLEANELYTRALLVSPGHLRALQNKQRTTPYVQDYHTTQLSRLDEKRDQLGKIPETCSSLRRIKKEAYFQHIYHTVGIEGNTMSLAETRQIVETRLAVGGKSVLEHNEILGLDSALAFINSSLVQRVGRINVQDILDIHTRVLGFVNPMDAGHLRSTQVFVGSHIPPHPSELELLMEDFVQWLNSEQALQLHPVEYAALAHYKLVFIHPFLDGNGRTGRLLMNLILMQAGFPPVIIRKQDRLVYYEMIQVANDGDVRPFIRFICGCTEKTLDVFLYATQEYTPALTEKPTRTISPDENR